MKTDVQNQRCERTKMQGQLTSMIMTNQIEAFPSRHLDAMRGLQKVSFILLLRLTSSHQDSGKSLTEEDVRRYMEHAIYADINIYKLRQVYFYSSLF
jgi:hypothetical protein